jgi:hypothetical protein
MDEEKKAMSGPKGRKAELFQRAVLNNRRREQPGLQGPGGAFEPSGETADKGVRAQLMKIRTAFGDTDAA